MMEIMFHVCYVAFLLHQCLGFIVNKPVADNATCLDVNPTCDFLNMTYSICNNTKLAREQCQLFCKLCDAEHGGWSGWTDWGSCSATCGVGLERRDRSCVNSWPSQDGNHCKGDHSDYRVCADALCTDGWDDWSDWGYCSPTCGPGMKHRNRTCNNTAASVIGGGCVGDSKEYAECYAKSCDTVVFFFARGPRDKTISTDEKIMYRAVTNKGGGYSSSTGVFTAPQQGLYSFTSQACVSPGHHAHTEITNRGAVLETSEVQNSNYYTCNTIQVAGELRVGERVWVQGTYSTSTLYEDPWRSNSFSGMLIK